MGDEPLLGEEGYWERPRAGLARLRQLAATAGVTAVSSQGGVIPDVVRALVQGSPHRLYVDPSAVTSRKVSTWVLGYAGSVLRSADYYAHPTGRAAPIRTPRRRSRRAQGDADGRLEPCAAPERGHRGRGHRHRLTSARVAPDARGAGPGLEDAEAGERHRLPRLDGLYDGGQQPVDRGRRGASV